MHDIAIATSQRHYFDRSALNYSAQIRAPLCDILMFEIIFFYARWVMPVYAKNISKMGRIIKLRAKFYRYHIMYSQKNVSYFTCCLLCFRYRYGMKVRSVKRNIVKLFFFQYFKLYYC